MTASQARVDARAEVHATRACRWYRSKRSRLKGGGCDGCPTGPREILDGGRYGLLVPLGNVAALADAMGRVVMDDTLRGELERGAAVRAREFGVEASNARFEACVDRMLARRAK